MRRNRPVSTCATVSPEVNFLSRVTIYDVAQEAGCSTATVSLVLKKSKRIKPETHQRVMQAVNKLGYTPNYLAQSLSNKSTKTLGLIVPNVENPLFSQFIAGIEEYARSQDYELILGISDSNSEKEDFYITMLQSKRVDGLLLFPTFLDALAEKISLLNSRETPLVLCGSSGNGAVGVSYVKCDNRVGSYTAVNHLIDTGCHRIGCIFPVIDRKQYESRLVGYRDALYYHNLPYDESLIQTCSPDSEVIYETTVQFLKATHPDGIFCLYDYAAIPVMKAIVSLGLRIPEDIRLIGYDNIYVSAYTPISLSTIDTHGYEVGRRAAELLIRQINNPEEPLHQIVIKPDLVIRDSTRLPEARPERRP